MAGFSSSIIDIVNHHENNKRQKLFEEMKEFPCLFNITNCQLDVGCARYTGVNICAPDLSRNKWEALQEELENDNEDSEFDDAVWKENLLTFTFAELGAIKDALVLNKKIQEKHGMNNLVTLANAAFLFYNKGDFSRAHQIIGDLTELKSDRRFLNLKIEAVRELGYAFRKFGGAKNLLCSISLLEYSLSIDKNDERLQFMLAMVYRRCTHFNIYTAEPENINRHDCALKAAIGLYQLSCSSKNKAIKSAALIELAYCKYNDDASKEKCGTDKQNYLSTEEWFQIVQERTWRDICEEAINVSGDTPTEKVLKIAGQLYRYSDSDEDLTKSEEFLVRAIKIKPSNRAYHHLGLTYRKMAVKFEKRKKQSLHNHQRSFQNKLKGAANGPCDRQDWLDKHPRYFTAHQSIPNPKFVNDNTRPESKYKSQKHNIYQGSFKCNREVEVDEGFKMLPAPPLDNSPTSLDNHLKYLTRVPDNYLMPFSKDNTFVEKAITQFKMAAEVSHYQNRPAVYDLAYILAQTQHYDESKQMCMKIISECSGPQKMIINYPVYLVNACNLYGVCCAKQAEMVEVDTAEGKKNNLLLESEKYLTDAVRVASRLADIPELTLCATDLWNAFKELKRKFTFEGQKDSREKLFKICELISDYRYLQAVEEILKQDPTELDKIEVVEKCLQRYLKMKAFDSALLFRDLINLRTKVKAKLPKSQVYKQLMLEIAEGKLSEDCVQVGSEVYHPDAIWKQLFIDEFQTARSCKKYEIVIAEDIDDDFELKRGVLCNIISQNLKLALQQTFGLNAVSSHEEGFPGTPYLTEQLQIISDASVAIFILTAPCLSSQSSSLEIDMACLSVSGSEHSEPEGAAANKTRIFGCNPEGPMTGSQSESEHLISRLYEKIINTSISNSVNNVGATRLLLVVPDSLKFTDLPQAARSLPRFELSAYDIETLAVAAQHTSSNEQFINLMKKIFRDVIDKRLVSV